MVEILPTTRIMKLAIVEIILSVSLMGMEWWDDGAPIQWSTYGYFPVVWIFEGFFPFSQLPIVPFFRLCITIPRPLQPGTFVVMQRFHQHPPTNQYVRSGLRISCAPSVMTVEQKQPMQGYPFRRWPKINSLVREPGEFLRCLWEERKICHSNIYVWLRMHK